MVETTINGGRGRENREGAAVEDEEQVVVIDGGWRLVAAGKRLWLPLGRWRGKGRERWGGK